MGKLIHRHLKSDVTSAVHLVAALCPWRACPRSDGGGGHEIASTPPICPTLSHARQLRWRSQPSWRYPLSSPTLLFPLFAIIMACTSPTTDKACVRRRRATRTAITRLALHLSPTPKGLAVVNSVQAAKYRFTRLIRPPLLILHYLRKWVTYIYFHRSCHTGYGEPR